MTPRSVTFAVVGIAQAKGSTRAFVPKGWTRPIITSTNKSVKGWQQLVAECAQGAAAGALFDGPVVLRVDFYLPRPISLRRFVVFHLRKPDLDKLVRATGDALAGILYRSDAQLVEIHARKLYATGATPPRAVITVDELVSAEPMAAPLFSEVPNHEPTPIP
jgi:Holliday junction resolvase RusA-like endonuclease